MNLRAPALSDVPAITRLFNRVSEELFGQSDESEDDVRRFLTSDELDPVEDIRVAEADGELVGYTDIFPHPHPSYWIDPRVAPSEEGDLPRQLLDWSLKRVRTRGGTHALAGVWSNDERLQDAFREAGFERTRGSYRMRIDFDGKLEEPRPPDGVGIRPMTAGDASVAHATHEETFADMWGWAPTSFEDWQHWFLGENHDWSLFFLAEEGEEAAGVALCRRRPTEPEVGAVRVLGVRRSWRRRGVGRALLLHAFAELRERGCTAVELGVDAQSLTGAHHLYESVGMRVVRHSDIYEKSLA